MTLLVCHCARPAMGIALLLGFLVAGGRAASAQADAVGPDFDGDGFTDLAIGAGGDAVGGVPRAGGVNVLYGSGVALTADGNQLWTQDSPGIVDAAEESDFFGRALSWGDFDGDGYDDLAIGAPGEDIAASVDPIFDAAGIVHVLYGSAAGLTTDRAQVWSQDSPDVPGVADRLDNFGFILAGTDFNGDGFDDLAISSITEDVETAGGTVSQAGTVTILYGSGAGLTAVGSQRWSQESPDVLGDPEASDTFGAALASGDLNGDGFDDLAIGVPSGFGEVGVLYGSVRGLTSAGNQLWDQDSPGVPGSRDGSDGFGAALTAADLNGDGFDDLAVGVPSESLRRGSLQFEGAVNVLYGSSAGLGVVNAQLWHQGQEGIAGYPERFDLFGSALAAADFDGDGFADLAIGVPLDDVELLDGKIMDVGSVNILFGAPFGLSSMGNRRRHQDIPGVPGRAEADDHFGNSLSAGDFDADGIADLAVGVLLDDAGLGANGGAVNVLYGTQSGTFTGPRDQIWHQDQPGVQGEASRGELFGEALP